jgi:hypothetical protein
VVGSTRRMLIGLTAVGLQAGLEVGARGMAPHPPAAPETIACRVIESKTAQTMGVGLVIFHHAEPASREQLGTFLQDHDGARVEIQTAGSDWQPATVFRLKTCFGRGLLAFPAARTRLARGQTFLIRASARSQ